MKFRDVINKQKKIVEIDRIKLNYLKNETDKVVSLLKDEIIKQKINTDIFIGGSYAKGTLLNREFYDIDILIRFDWRVENISDKLESIAKNALRRISKIHGSRDYFRFRKGQIVFELIPVYKIKNPKEAGNVTDISYFHVNYIRKKISKNKTLAGEIMLAKKFCLAQNVYGAESYVNGFSGYGIECLIVYYKSFEKMLKKLVSVKDRLLIDPENRFKKEDALFELNENKLQSPIILIDPTWRDRNLLAALSKETFKKFQESALKFLKNPSNDFFELKQIDINKIKKSAKTLNAELVNISMKTDKQEGDIAGTKMKKFSRFLENEIKKYFDIFISEFIYSNGKESGFYLVVKPKKEYIRLGPPKNMKENASAFRARNKNVFEKKGRLYARERINFSCREFLEKLKNESKRKIIDMGIVGMEIM